MEEEATEHSKSAGVIQRAFRRYVQRKNKDKPEAKQGAGEDTSNAILIEEVDMDENLSETSLYGDVEKLREFSTKVINDVNLFYQKYYSNAQKKRNIRKLCSEIEDISMKLKAVTKLDRCRTLPANFSEKADKAKKRHEEHVERVNTKWWQRINFLYDI